MDVSNTVEQFSRAIFFWLISFYLHSFSAQFVIVRAVEELMGSRDLMEELVVFHMVTFLETLVE